jgi:hypothetical protein
MENQSPPTLETSAEELLLLIGERELVKHKQALQIRQLLTQVEEMSQTITGLRRELEEITGTKVVELKRG